ncbi:MAG: MFS transporter [Chloroflexota bacterium]
MTPSEMNTPANNGEAGKNEEAAKKRQLGYFHAEAAATAVASAGNAYQTASIVASGAEARVVATLSTLTNLVAGLVYVKLPYLVGKVGSRKKTILVLSSIDAVGWLPLVAVLWFLGRVNPIWLILLWVFNLIPGMITALARDSWLADSVPASRMGRYFGWRSAISGAAYLGTLYIMGYVLNIFKEQALGGFAVIFLVAFLASAVAILIYGLLQDTAGENQKQAKFGFLDFVREAKQEHLAKFIIFISLFSFAVALSSPFVAIYMLQDLKFSYMVYTVALSSEYIARIISVVFWGRYADRVGNLKVMGIASFAIPFVPVLWLASQGMVYNMAYLIGLQLFTGVAWAGFDLCSNNFIYKAAPAGKRLWYIVYKNSFVTLSTALGAFLGAYLLVHIFPVFGSKILGLFLLSAILRFGVVRFMFRSLKEATSATMPSSVEADLIPVPQTSAVSPEGLFYRPQAWALFSKKPLATAAMTARAEAVAPQEGLFHRPQTWALFNKKPLATAAIAARAEAIAPQQGLFYQPQSWALFNKKPLATAAITARAGAVVPQLGLFHRPQTWALFNNKPLATAAVAAQAGAVVPQEGLYHRPQEWASFCQKPVAARAKAVASQPGLFNRLHDWAGFRKLAADKTPSARYSGQLQPVPVVA